MAKVRGIVRTNLLAGPVRKMVPYARQKYKQLPEELFVFLVQLKPLSEVPSCERSSGSFGRSIGCIQHLLGGFGHIGFGHGQRLFRSFLG